MNIVDSRTFLFCQQAILRLFNDNFRADLLKNMKKMTIYTSLIMGVFVALSGASLSQAQTSVTTNQAGANAKIDVLGGGFTPLTNIGVSQSRIVVYRTFNTQQLPGATGVFIQGQYHTSLVPGGYSQLCLPPGQFEVGARQFRVGQNARDSYDTITAIALPPAQTQYVRVEESSGRPVMKPVTAAQALWLHLLWHQSYSQNNSFCRAIPCLRSVVPISMV
jgi:hypothetical protein